MKNPASGAGNGEPAAAPDVELESVSYPALAVPLAISIAGLSLFFFFRGGDAALEILTTAVATATVLGKFVVVRGLVGQGFFDSPWKLAVLVVYLDLMVAFIAVYNTAFLYRVPRLGKRLALLQRSGEQILARNPWMRKVTFVGIVAFVMFPLSGTGAIGGALFGRLLGLSRRRTMAGIAIGAVVGSFSMAALAEIAGDALIEAKDNPIFAIAGLLVLGSIAYWLYRRSRVALTMSPEQSGKNPKGGPESGR